MAGLKYSATTNGATGLTQLALAGATEKCVFVMSAAANKRALIKSIGFYFDGATSTNTPVQVVLCRTTGAGSNSTSITPKLLTAGSETAQTTCAMNMTSTDMPTKGDILAVWNIHPQSGYQWVAPLGEEITVPGGGYAGLFMKAAQAVNVAITVNFEE